MPFNLKYKNQIIPVDNTRDYARISHSRQWSNYNQDNSDAHKFILWFLTTTSHATWLRLRC